MEDIFEKTTLSVDKEPWLELTLNKESKPDHYWYLLDALMLHPDIPEEDTILAHYICNTYMKKQPFPGHEQSMFDNDHVLDNCIKYPNWLRHTWDNVDERVLNDWRHAMMMINHQNGVQEIPCE